MSPPAGVAQLRRGLYRGVRDGAVVAAVAVAVLTVVAALVAGWPGVRGALIGGALAAAFLLVTAVVAARTTGRDALVVATVMLVSWLVKVVLALVVLGVVRTLDGVDRLWVGLGLLVGLVVTLAAEYRAVTSARIPYVEPGAGPRAPAPGG